MIVEIRETRSCDKASKLSLVYKALPYMGIEHSSDSEAHHLTKYNYNHMPILDVLFQAQY